VQQRVFDQLIEQVLEMIAERHWGRPPLPPNTSTALQPWRLGNEAALMIERVRPTSTSPCSKDKDSLTASERDKL
jgi:hypothetical protein